MVGKATIRSFVEAVQAEHGRVSQGEGELGGRKILVLTEDQMFAVRAASELQEGDKQQSPRDVKKFIQEYSVYMQLSISEQDLTRRALSLAQDILGAGSLEKFKASDVISINEELGPEPPPVNRTLTDRSAPVLPKHLRLAKMEGQFSQKSHVEKEAIAEKHAQRTQKGIVCAPLDGWHAYRATSDGALQADRVTATSERATSGNSDLTNAYVHISDDGEITLSSGVIDTFDKADEWMSVYITAVKDYAKRTGRVPQLHVTMHQLNANSNESKLIQQQHVMVAYINRALPRLCKRNGIDTSRNKPQVLHVNRCMNAASDRRLTRTAEARAARELNALAYAKQVTYFCGRKSDGSFSSEQLQAVTNLLINTEAVEKELDGAVNAAKEFQRKNPRYSDELTDIAQRMAALEDVTDEDSLERNWVMVEQEAERLGTPSPIDVRSIYSPLIESLTQIAPALCQQKAPELKLLGQILMAEYVESDQTTQSEKLCLEMFLDSLSDTATSLNCWSGLDRTGIARCLRRALQHKFAELKATLGDQEKASEALIGFISNFSAGVRSLDKVKHPAEGTPEYEVLRFQARFFQELVGVALPITYRSSGLIGLKVHHDKKLGKIRRFVFDERNPHLLQWLPKQVFDEDSGEYVRLVTFSDKGERELTEAGKAIICCLSQRRGA